MVTTTTTSLKTARPAPTIGAMAGSGPIEALLREHRGELVGFVRRRIGHLVDPEDVLQQAAVRALSSANSLQDPTRVRAWFFRILRNVITDELRALGVPTRALSTDDEGAADPPAEAAGVEDQACTCALALAQTLKPEYRDVLERVVIDETPVTSLAAELGVTPNNATVRLHRARRALRVILREHCGTDSLRARLDCACDQKGCNALRFPDAVR